MDLGTPPPLRLTRQWTQPTTFEHHSLSRVAYPSAINLSLSPAPSPRSNGGGSGARPACRSPTVSSTAASPLPSRPSPLPQEHRTPRRKAPVPVTAGAALTAPVLASPSPASRGQQQSLWHADDEGRYFWQQQARRLEEANMALRAELHAVYHAATDKSGVAREGEMRSCHGTGTHFPDPARRDALPNGSYVDERCFAAVVTERNVARMELAQERELNFLLRHRLREMEIALEQAEQRSFHHKNYSGDDARGRRVLQVSRSNYGASTRGETADTAAMKPKRSAAVASPPHRLPVSRAAASYSASTASSSSRASSRAPSSASPRSDSSPRIRSVTRGHTSHQSNSSNIRERSERRIWSSLPKSTESSHHSGPSRLSRGYERLRRRAEARACPHSLSTSTPSSASMPRPAMSVRSSSSPLSPAQETFPKEAPPTFKQQQQQHQPPRPNGCGGKRELEGRALLSSLLSAHPAAPSHAGSTEQQQELVALRGEPQLRHTFRSCLFGNAQEGKKEGEAAGSAVMPLGEGERSPLSDPSAASLAASYVVRRHTSPASVTLHRTSPYGTDSISEVVAQRPSRSASRFSVSVTTENGNSSRSPSLREKPSENTAWSAAFRSFSL